jgi:putative ABC transport system ATP-binding protein
MEPAALITVEDLRFSYRGSAERRFRLHVASLRVNAGERVALVGPSGSGKTTLLHLVAGVLVPESGRVCVLGTDVARLSEAGRREFRLRRIGMVFQEFELLEYVSAIDNIMLGAFVGDKLDPAVRSARAVEVAAASGISHVLARKPRELSQGERQRVALCRALVASPSLILCDEPTGNLDPESTSRVLDLLLSGAASARAGVLMVTHNHSILHRFDRVLAMADVARAERAPAGVRP